MNLGDLIKNFGALVITAGVDVEYKNNVEFAVFIGICMNRYINNDWGDLCEEDYKLNTEALLNGTRVLAAYNIPEKLNIGRDKIWVITEADRSVTTILFPDEY